MGLRCRSERVCHQLVTTNPAKSSPVIASTVHRADRPVGLGEGAIPADIESDLRYARQSTEKYFFPPDFRHVLLETYCVFERSTKEWFADSVERAGRAPIPGGAVSIRRIEVPLNTPWTTPPVGRDKDNSFRLSRVDA